MSGGGMTLEEFIAWSSVLDDPKRWELHSGVPVQRPASWWLDGRLKSEVLSQLHGALEGDPGYELLGFGPLVVVGPTTAVEPHLAVVPRNAVDWDSFVLPDPLVVVEMPRADGSVQYWAPRLRAYATLPTVQHILAVHAAARTALHLRRAANGTMTGRVLRGGTVELAPPGVSLDLDRVWARLDRRSGSNDRG